MGFLLLLVNKLEQELYVKLQEPSLLASLKADALMFYFVYADLVTLAKSRDLDKSAYDMSQHYLELKIYLEELEKFPEITNDKEYQVFSSEPRLYESNSNHRNRHQQVWNRLFHKDDFDNILHQQLPIGAAAMKEKLFTYASSQLPGGEHWGTDAATKSVLTMIKPTNDLCESMLGLNNYLTTAIPNMDQLSRGTWSLLKKTKQCSG